MTVSSLPTPMVFSNKTWDCFEKEKKKKNEQQVCNSIHAHPMTGCGSGGMRHTVTLWHGWNRQITGILG